MNVSLPLITTDKEEALRCVNLINKSFEHKMYGEFIAISPINFGFNYAFKLNSKSIPASQATADDFAMKYSAKNHEILADSSEFTFRIDVMLIQFHLLTDPMDQILQLADHIDQDTSSTSIVDVAKSMRSIAQSSTKHAAEAAIDPKELTLNKLLLQIVAPVAINLGYIITANSPKGSDETVGQFSRFSSSRPDLALYSKYHHCGFYLIKREEALPEDKQGDTQDPALLVPSCDVSVLKGRESCICGGITEAKLSSAAKSPLYQLVGGMENLAGDLVVHHLRSCNSSFSLVKIYGLIIDYDSFTCDVYLLEMNFTKRESLLYEGEHLDLNVGINRLLSTLEKWKSC